MNSSQIDLVEVLGAFGRRHIVPYFKRGRVEGGRCYIVNSEQAPRFRKRLPQYATMSMSEVHCSLVR